MTPEATAVSTTPAHVIDAVPADRMVQLIEERTRAIAEVAEGLRPLIGLAGQPPDVIAILMDSFDDAMRTASARGIDIERGLLNGTEAALRFGATMDADKVRELEALFNSGVFAPATLRVIGELGRALTETAAAAPSSVGALGLLKALGQPDVQRALGFLVSFAERFGRRLREPPAAQH